MRTTLVCSSKKDQIELLKAEKGASQQRGLLLNTKKTKVMFVEEGRNITGNDFSVDGEVIEEVERFDFLGSIINVKGDCTQEIKRRLALARNNYSSKHG